MTGESYRACAAWLGKTPRRASFFRCLFRLLPLVDAAVYLGTAAFLVITSWPGRWKFLLIPAVTFLLVSLLRRALNRPRPYDRLGYTPFLPAEPGKGKSFPSRHTASAAAIACAFGFLSPAAGAAAGLLALAIGASRVIGGAHYLGDVLGGLLFPLPFALLYLL